MLFIKSFGNLFVNLFDFFTSKQIAIQSFYNYVINLKIAMTYIEKWIKSEYAKTTYQN